jgi:hypothetical protein
MDVSVISLPRILICLDPQSLFKSERCNTVKSKVLEWIQLTSSGTRHQGRLALHRSIAYLQRRVVGVEPGSFYSSTNSSCFTRSSIFRFEREHSIQATSTGDILS